MGSRKMENRQENIRQSLVAPGVLCGVDEVVSAASVGSDYINSCRLWPLISLAPGLCITGFQHNSGSQVDLIFDSDEPLMAALIYRGRDRVQRTETRSRSALVASQQIDKQDVGGREIHLRMQNITSPNTCGPVLTFRKIGNDRLTVFGVHTFGEPGAALTDGSGDIEARRVRSDV